MKIERLIAVALAAIPSANGNPVPQDLPFRMLESIVARGQATIDSGASTGFIQLVCQRCLISNHTRKKEGKAKPSQGSLLASSRSDNRACTHVTRK